MVTQRIGGGNHVLVVSYDDNKYYTFNSTNTILPKNKDYPLKYLVGLLNSRLLNWYYVNKFTNKSTLTVNISKTFLEQLPIKITSETQQKNIKKMVDQVIDLSRSLLKFGNKQTNERAEIEERKKDTEEEINQEVYKLYGITAEEQKIMEESLK